MKELLHLWSCLAGGLTPPITYKHGPTKSGVCAGGVSTGGVCAGGASTGGVCTGGVRAGGVTTGGVCAGGVTACVSLFTCAPLVCDHVSLVMSDLWAQLLYCLHEYPSPPFSTRLHPLSLALLRSVHVSDPAAGCTPVAPCVSRSVALAPPRLDGSAPPSAGPDCCCCWRVQPRWSHPKVSVGVLRPPEPLNSHGRFGLLIRRVSLWFPSKTTHTHTLHTLHYTHYTHTSLHTHTTHAHTLYYTHTHICISFFS